MTLADFRGRLARLFGGGSEDSSRRPDGGTSCYRPVRRKNRDEAAEGVQNAPPQQEGGSVPYIHTGFTGMNPPSEYSYAAQPSGGYAPRQEPPRDNISYMPGVFAPDAGNSYTHVEHIMAMTSLKSCYEAIECMKNGETLIVSLEAIANEGETMRCQDMLAGAAFTLGCHVRMLQGGRTVLIAPENVKILPEEAPVRQEFAPVPPYAAAYAQQAADPEASRPGRRERRVSQRTAEYMAARSGELPNYNPYTGNAPAAVGDYAAFGGYGYDPRGNVSHFG